MSDYSKLPAIHNLLQSIPYPALSWNEVITTYPSLTHVYWSFLFAFLSALLQLICYGITELLSPYLIAFIAHDRGISPSEISRHKERFQEMLFPLFSRLCTFSFGLYTVYQKDWVYDRKLFYYGWPNEQQLDCCEPDIKLLYIAYIGWYMYKLFGLFFLDRHLKDFFASFTHHCATLLLLALSYNSGLLRVGTVIILLHDPADIMMQVGRFFKIMQIDSVVTFFFGLFIVTWIMTRVIIYPSHCVLSGLYDFWVQHPDCALGMRITGYILTSLMCVLFGLHVYWTKLMIEAIIRKIQGKGVVDPRSGSDTES